MKIFLLILLISFSAKSQNFNFQRSYGSYYFDERFRLNDSKVDSQGNLYIVGTALGIDVNQYLTFVNTNNSYHNNYYGGNSDGFILKINKFGQTLWGTFVGGLQDDTIASIDIDSNDNIYILGNTNSDSFVATTNAYQQVKSGGTDFMLARFSSNGVLDWCTYYGGNGNESILPPFAVEPSNIKAGAISHDKTTNFYMAGVTDSNNLGTSGTYIPIPIREKGVISKFNDQGILEWTTYYTQDKDFITSINASASALYVSGIFDGCDNSTGNGEFGLSPPASYYGTSDGLFPLTDICYTQFLSKFSFAGQRLWSTYFENSNICFGINNCIKTYQNKIYLSGNNNSGSLGTNGVFQQTCNSNNSLTNYLTQFSEDGTRNWTTYNGFPYSYAGVGYSSVTLDDNGDPYLHGTVTDNFTQNIATPNSYQTTINGNSEGFISKFNQNGQKQWGTYYGGNAFEESLSFLPHSNGFYLVGTTQSENGMTTPNAELPNYELHDLNSSYPSIIYLAHFLVNPLTTTKNALEKLELYPNPNKGSFSIKGNFAGLQNLEMVIYDNQGRTIYNKKLTDFEDNTSIDLENKLQSGIYFVKIFNSEIEKTIKTIIE
jgi:hypothetical protein